MFVSDALAVYADAFEGEDALFGREPSAVKLVVWHDAEEEKPDGGRQDARYEEDDFPGGHDGPVGACCDGDAVGEEAAEDLHMFERC